MASARGGGILGNRFRGKQGRMNASLYDMPRTAQMGLKALVQRASLNAPRHNGHNPRTASSVCGVAITCHLPMHAGKGKPEIGHPDMMIITVGLIPANQVRDQKCMACKLRVREAVEESEIATKPAQTLLQQPKRETCMKLCSRMAVDLLGSRHQWHVPA